MVYHSGFVLLWNFSSKSIHEFAHRNIATSCHRGFGHSRMALGTRLRDDHVVLGTTVSLLEGQATNGQYGGRIVAARRDACRSSGFALICTTNYKFCLSLREKCKFFCRLGRFSNLSSSASARKSCTWRHFTQVFFSIIQRSVAVVFLAFR